MKNYTLAIKDIEERKKQQRKFILKYQVKENKDGDRQMVIYYANGCESHIDYSKSFEAVILHLMECQVKEYELGMKKYEQEYKSKLNSLNLENRLGVLVVSVIVIIGMIITINYGMLLLILIISTFLLGGLVNDILKLINKKRIINDFNKMKLFIQNKEKVNKNIFDRDNKFINEISDIFSKILNDQREITINSLDKISLKKLEKIVKNVELKENFEAIEQECVKMREVILAKEGQFESQVREESRKPCESLLTIEDVARLRSVDELNYQYRLYDENKSSFINEYERYSGYNISAVKRRVRRKK